MVIFDLSPMSILITLLVKLLSNQPHLLIKVLLFQLHHLILMHSDIWGPATYHTLTAISASVLNRAGSKIKMVRPSVELKDRVILLNYILKLN
jgi:hypothetical protein